MIETPCRCQSFHAARTQDVSHPGPALGSGRFSFKEKPSLSSLLNTSNFHKITLAEHHDLPSHHRNEQPKCPPLSPDL